MEKNKSAAIQSAHDNFEMQRKRLKEKGYEEKPEIISVVKANIMTFLLALPFFIIFIFLFLKIWDSSRIQLSIKISVFIIWLISIPVHELLHGIGWSFSCEKRFKSIRFGMMWTKLTPYCSCKEPLGFWQYLAGGLLPFLILGLIPSTIAVFIGNSDVLIFGLLGIVAAGGDMLICLNLLKHPGAVFMDHPTECGFYAFCPPQNNE